ncbi:hypothetical protein SISNIDRAFT_489234 [Sistotremastrum niveocremeum HHB9708]|uniref:Uncharacterized protein n=1 Tax=Sistotremastrum niveocremeum HHB9708 TaxID=1314777 RepID=A0A164QD63_9AGAM|nr:hypothetical protein SISNIDRAFT_489234 [Sistotremastrum niveocremeum HHB9708]
MPSALICIPGTTLVRVYSIQDAFWSLEFATSQESHPIQFSHFHLLPLPQNLKKTRHHDHSSIYCQHLEKIATILRTSPSAYSKDIGSLLPSQCLLIYEALQIGKSMRTMKQNERSKPWPLIYLVINEYVTEREVWYFDDDAQAPILPLSISKQPHPVDLKLCGEPPVDFQPNFAVRTPLTTAILASTPRGHLESADYGLLSHYKSSYSALPPFGTRFW